MLGFRVSKGPISPHPAKVEAIVELPQPRTKKELMYFLNVTLFYARFNPQHARQARPLRRLLTSRAQQLGEWTNEHAEAFEALKDGLRNALVIAPFDADGGPLTLATDFSKIGMGYILTQRGDDGAERIVAANSRSTTKQQANYGAADSLRSPSAFERFFVHAASRNPQASNPPQ